MLQFEWKSQGCIYTVSVNSHTGSISRSHRNRSSKSRSPITTVEYRTFSLVARGPVLLACTQDGSLCFFRFYFPETIWLHQSVSYPLGCYSLFEHGALCSVALEIQGYLTLLCSLKLAPRVHRIHASFCPLLSLEKGEFIGRCYNMKLGITFVLSLNFSNAKQNTVTVTHSMVNHVWNKLEYCIWLLLCLCISHQNHQWRLKCKM